VSCADDLRASKGYTDSRAEATLIGRKGGTGPDVGLLHGVCVEVHGMLGYLGRWLRRLHGTGGNTCFVQRVVTYRCEEQGKLDREGSTTR
jgi:hypothetical protein